MGALFKGGTQQRMARAAANPLVACRNCWAPRGPHDARDGRGIRHWRGTHLQRSGPGNARPTGNETSNRCANEGRHEDRLAQLQHQRQWLQHARRRALDGGAGAG
jgi:hypothetical protein